MTPGAWYSSEQTLFSVWAPFRNDVRLEILTPRKSVHCMERDEKGYYHCTVPAVSPGATYRYILDNTLRRPDPASFSQPQGVHGPSQVVDHGAFHWDEKGWAGIPAHHYICYELHCGTFTDEGTLAAAARRCDYLSHLGVTAIELMPVIDFPGTRNWGYDGVFPFSVHGTYGGMEGLKQFVNECHRNGLAVVLDVVYNHLGPEGNYLRDFGPYFTDKYTTPWGEAVNFDGRYSDEVRAYFIANALYWYERFHIDALRLDAVHALYDFSAQPFLALLAGAVHEHNGLDSRTRCIFVESDLNDSRLIRPYSQGGYAIDAQWSDDFHHALHVKLTGEQAGILGDFGGEDTVGAAYTNRFVYEGQYSTFRKRSHGNRARDLAPQKFIVCIQNHDQVGNRAEGERLSSLVDFESLKCAAAATILSPCIPLLFMGEEYGETSPFLYFVDHSDPGLKEAVRSGRKREFMEFHEGIEPPDPFAPETFLRCKLSWNAVEREHHALLLEFYRTIIRIRKKYHLGECGAPDNASPEQHARGNIISLYYATKGPGVGCVFNFSKDLEQTGKLDWPDMEKVFDSSDVHWRGPGTRFPEFSAGPPEGCWIQPRSCAVFTTRTNSDTAHE
ncbi:MAG: malto-oligosyltrehalose trehalohydrolase [Chitinivibrionales bacterium]|nr:malto-oligosyltrehalose trehalohydrolase [Chitinivibrionales bacterium]